MLVMLFLPLVLHAIQVAVPPAMAQPSKAPVGVGLRLESPELVPRGHARRHPPHAFVRSQRAGVRKTAVRCQPTFQVGPDREHKD